MDRPRVITKQVHSEKFRKAGIMVFLLNVTTCVADEKKATHEQLPIPALANSHEN